ncbi:MAG: hypothetical protein WBQ86_06275 [Candidatus Binatus sp.]
MIDSIAQLRGKNCGRGTKPDKLFQSRKTLRRYSTLFGAAVALVV